MKLIQILHDSCAGCRICEMVCSLVHEGECSTTKSRVRIFRDEEFGNNLVSLCQQCADAHCLDSCSFGALSRNEKTGAIVVDDASCTACEECIVACPIGAIHMDNEKNIVFKCDLCGGDPKCVKFCARETITLRDVDPASPERELFMAETSKLLSHMKA